MSAESVAVIPRCVECGAIWLPTDEDRWEAYLTDDEPPELAFYCPKCAEREFKPAWGLALGFLPSTPPRSLGVWS